MKTAIILIAIVHGLIHLLGFLKAFRLAEIQQLSLSISPSLGWVWLLAVILFMAFAILRFLENPVSGYVGILAVIISQLLIFSVWQDAKFGTIPNIFILFASIQMLFISNWNQKLENEKVAFQEKIKSVKLRQISELPEPVIKWLKQIGFNETHPMIMAEIHQRAEMKMNPDQKDWKAATAFQLTRLSSPAFHWEVEMQMLPGIKIFGRDQCLNGKGEMVIRLGGIFPIVDEKGEKIDEGSIQRLLGELVWIPSLALHPAISWQALNENSAKATLTIGETTGAGTFFFDEKGDFIRFEALRFYENKPESKRFPWILTVQEYSTFQDIRVPSKMLATWRLEKGDWTWLNLTIAEIKYKF
ncbi:hypothetical protein E4S40_13595 [Algoriphagus kandeliae]|uniref:Uncharacterized protein n=1 Tax=Algoriphagus kandeliae TaxID=2562278 RepID=A0A4Y9QM62_9BACT|nr:DUF6544 family protein [Algoriphagus kandeliae]TFV93287.1 hypothetical protein E4S40_13595 [Algoriphagus kandeliae]